MNDLNKQIPVDQALRELPLQQAPDDCWQQIAAHLDQQTSAKPRQRGSYWGAIAASVAAIGLVVVLWPGAEPAIQGGGGAEPLPRFGESLALMSRSTYSTDQALEEIAMLSWIQEIDDNRHYGDLRQQVSLRRQRDQLSAQLLESAIRVPDKGIWL
ncbi:hypothetical protein ACVBEJ_13195 [Porticoccus sp. GXU_MW_L64]